MKQIIKGEQVEPRAPKRRKRRRKSLQQLQTTSASNSAAKSCPTQPAKHQISPSTLVVSLTTTLTTTVTASNHLSLLQVPTSRSKSGSGNSSYATRAGSDLRKTSGWLAACSRLNLLKCSNDKNDNNNNGNNNRISPSSTSYRLECPKMCPQQPERKRTKEKLATYLIAVAVALVVSELFTCQRCLHSPAFVLPCSASQLDLQPQPQQQLAASQATSNNTSSVTSISSKETTTTAAPIMKLQPNSSPSASALPSGFLSASTKSVNATFTSTLSQNPINKHNVLCNSRCHCLILAPLLLPPSSTLSAQNTSSLTPSTDAHANLSASQQLLVAFSEDYELEADEQENSDIEDLTLGAELDLLDSNNNRSTTAAITSRTNEVNRTESRTSSQPQSGSSFYSPLTSNSLRKQLTNRGKALGTGPRESSLSSGPQLYAQSLYSSQAPKLSYHAHSPYLKSVAGAGVANSVSGPSNPEGSVSSSTGTHHLPSSVNNGRGQLTGAVKLVKLRALDLGKKMKLSSKLSEYELATSIRSLLESLETSNAQSLSLSDNELQFELWSELYALLATHLRQRILRLDLSRNSLTKLGITFTGHLEHLLAAHSSAWPLAGKRGVSSLLGAGHFYMQLRNLTANNNNHTVSQQNSTFSLIQQPILIRALDLSHNKIKWLINDQFKALKLIQAIKLNNNKIRYIHQHAFSGLESLRYLNLNANKLQVIYIEQFQTNYNLLSLTLRFNQLSYLRGGSFASMSNLRRLDLSRNKLTLVSNNAFLGLELLELLNCSSNKLDHVPSAALHPLTSLRRLDLSENLIAQLSPGTFFHLPVEELWLERNELLVSIERGAFWDLPYLRKLHLNGNLALSNINLQAFVATQSLQSIETDSCPSMEASSRQLFDNVTLAATARLLRHELTKPANRVVIATNSPSTAAQHNNDSHSSNGELPGKQQIFLPFATNQAASLIPASSLKQTHLMSVKNALYYLGTVTLLAIALKLVFKYTTTSRYITSRRERRRVYQLSKPVDGGEFELTQAHGHPLVGELSCQHVITPSTSSPSPSSTLMSQPSPASSSDFTASLSSANLDSESREEESGCSFNAAAAASAQLELDHQHLDRSEDISVISGATFPYQFVCCPLGCPPSSEHPQDIATHDLSPQQLCHQSLVQSQELQLGSGQQQEQQHPANTVDLIHSQLVAAGFDYGHANCAHFYQSLGPALQLADMTANLVNHMDYY